MATYEIWWDDLTDEAKDRLSGLCHDNVGIAPIAIVDVEPDEEPEDCDDI